MTNRQERTAFTALVLSGIWMLARLQCAKYTERPYIAMSWRADAIGHMDVVGQESSEAKEYRRSDTFPPIYL